MEKAPMTQNIIWILIHFLVYKILLMCKDDSSFILISNISFMVGLSYYHPTHELRYVGPTII